MTGIVNSRSSTSSALPPDSIAGDLRTKLPAHADTLAGSILDRVTATPDREAFRYPGGNGAWDSMTWGQAGDEIETLAAGLVSLGLRVGDRVAIASSTRLEWILADSAIMCAGGATTTIYPNTHVDDVVFILADSGSRILFAENADQAAKAANDRDRLPDLMAIVVIDGPGDDDRIISMDSLRALGAATLAADPGVIDARVAGLTPDSLATLIYTSGTTGRPKGVELTHRSWVFQGASLDALGIITIEDLQYLWLPLSHSFGKVLLAFGVQVGFATAVDGRVPELVTNLATIRPTFMAGVPRIFEKIYTAANNRAEEGSALKRRIYGWAVHTSAGIKASRRSGHRTGRLATMELALADLLVFNKVTALTGGRIRYFVCGSAALDRDVARWFDAAGMPILEGYGLTETSAATCLVRPDDQAFGTVGQPLPGTEIRIAADGEIRVRRRVACGPCCAVRAGGGPVWSPDAGPVRQPCVPRRSRQALICSPGAARCARGGRRRTGRQRPVTGSMVMIDSTITGPAPGSLRQYTTRAVRSSSSSWKVPGHTATPSSGYGCGSPGGGWQAMSRIVLAHVQPGVSHHPLGAARPHLAVLGDDPR